MSFGRIPECRLKHDSYTRFVLTVIAACLVILVVQTSTPSAHAQSGVSKVALCNIDGTRCVYVFTSQDGKPQRCVRPLSEMSQNAVIAPSPTKPWVWLFPLAYGLHIAEEYAFHFPAYVANVSGWHISNSQFLFLNAVLWFLMVAAIVVVLARPSHAWLVITLATVLGINAAVHLLGSIVTATYSPGTVTAALLYVPLAVYALRRVLPQVSRGVTLRAVALGAIIHAGAFFLAANPSLIPSLWAVRP